MKKANPNPVKMKPIESNLNDGARALNLEGGSGRSRKQTLIVVLGMHRSGTSATARGLQVLGVELGDMLAPPKEDNAKGFWEDIELNALNIEMLEAIGSDWHHLSTIQPKDVDLLRDQGYFLRAVELLRKKVGNNPIFGFKDPRVAKLIPFWKEILSHIGWNIGYVLIIRNPLSVVKSLAERDGFDSERSYLMWLGHVLESLINTQEERRILVDYDLLMQAPKNELLRMSDIFGLKVDEAKLEIYQNQFLDSELRHSVYTADDLSYDFNCPPLVREIYSVLSDVAIDKIKLNDTGLLNNIDRWRNEFDRLSYPMKLVDKQSVIITELTDETVKRGEWGLGLERQLKEAVANRDAQIAGLTDEVVKRGEWALELERQLKEAVANRDAQISELTDEVVKRGELTLGLERQLKDALECDGIVSEFRNKAINYSNKIVALEQQLHDVTIEHEEQISELTDEIVRYGKRALKLERQLTDVLAERDAQIAELTDETVRRGAWALDLDRQLNEAQSKIDRLSSKKNRKMMLLLRKFSRWLFEQRYPKALIKSAGKAYVSLPLSYHTRAVHRRILARYAPSILRVSEGLPASMSYMPSVTVLPVTDSAPDAETIKLMVSMQPVVSIIIPIYGKCDYTLRCLRSIANKPPVTAFEIIVINDCSPDNSAEILQPIEGIQLISNTHNQGFIRSCNIGAKAAKGQYLHFLNNDTEVTENWLDELVRTFKNLPGTGFAGSKLLYPDGKLQEAGGIIWQDGSAWNFGRYQNPLLPEFNYAREVDYCSGASIVVPKELFDELGGFDEHYLPAYGEDSDLALKIRDRGYRVIYQPLSVVIHHEGITSGTDVTQGTKHYQIENGKKLFQRWQERLKRHQINGTDVDNAKDRMADRRVLVLDHCTPTPNQDAGSVTVFNLLLLLREMAFQVTFIPEDNFLYMPGYTQELQRNGIEVIYAPYVTSVEQHLKDSARHYDLFFLFRPKVVERHLKTIGKFVPNAKILYHTVDLHYLRMTREAELLKDAGKKRKADEMKLRELAILRTVDASIVHSTTELEILSKELPDAKIHVFPLIMNVCGINKKFEERKDIVFVGGYQHPPNVDAVEYFVTKIMPLLRSRLPGVHFYAVGSQVPAEINALSCEDVIVTGFVENLNSLLDQMRVSVAPLRYGAGIKGKIGSAMAVGLPVVATSLAAEGMSLTDGDNILVAEGDSAEQFAEAVVRLYLDKTLWNRISQNGLEFAENFWGAEAAWKILNTILTDISIITVRGVHPLSLFSESDMTRKKTN